MPLSAPVSPDHPFRLTRSIALQFDMWELMPASAPFSHNFTPSGDSYAPDY